MNDGTMTLKAGDLVTLYGEMWKVDECIPALSGKHVKRGNCIFPVEECEKFDRVRIHRKEDEGASKISVCILRADGVELCREQSDDFHVKNPSGFDG